MKTMKLLVLAASLAASFGASSMTTDWGTHDDPVEVGFDVVKTGGVPTGFTDLYTFLVAPGFTLTGSTVVASNSQPVLSILGGTYSLLSYGTDGTLGTADDSVVGTWGFNGSTGSVVNAVSAGAGKYLYAVSGVAVGSFAGVYTITSTIAPVTAVPEPSPLVLLAAGLGVFGLLAKRRKV
jgi:hypothetical protein